ncbi:hypothetical protein [Leifsonia sp. NPDC058230]|uniref:hypothetical protein n=1 Tax=Leifsonia sp. NPDC058230 TaxID=3346391 RepID=UPI0036DC7159
MSDNRGLPNVNSEGVPEEDIPERFEESDRDAQAAEPAETESGQSEDAASTDDDAAEPPPADFDPAQHPSNPDLVDNVDPPE